MKRIFAVSHVLAATIWALALSPPVLASDSDFTDGITVDSTLDAPDSNPGDGICDDGAGNCTLRAAIQEANLNPGEDTIDLSQINDPTNPIVLTINGVDEYWEAATSGTQPYVAVDNPDASKGDLDITDSIRIVGAGSDKTVIEWSLASKTDGDPATGDRVFQAQAVNANISVYIAGLTIRNGSVGVVNSTDPSNPYNIEVMSDGTIWQFKRSGGAITLGVGAAVALYTPTTHGSGEGGGGGSGGRPPGGEGETSFSIESATLSDVVLIDNSSGADGGGLYNTAPLTLEHAVLWGNSAGANGGAVYNDGAMTMTDSSLGILTTDTNSTANTAENGGGLFDTGSHTTNIIRSAINGNTATGGGAIAGRSLVRIDIVNSTIDGNSATDVGGGVTTNGTISLLNSTVTANLSASDSTAGGAGLNSFGSGTYLLKNTIIAGNLSSASLGNCGCTGGECTAGNQFVTQGHNLEDSDSCALTGTGDLVNTDPQLKALANNGGPTDTRALPSVKAGDASTSPAIDAGDDNGCPNNDQRDSLRPTDGDLNGSAQCDIGAFEMLVPTADLQIQDLVAPDQVVKGTSAPVAITVLNADTTATATGIELTTTALPAEVTINSASFTVGSGTTPTACAVANQIVTCAIGSLTAGQTATAALSLTPNAVGDLSFNATAQAAAPADANMENNTAGATISVIGIADLGLTASIANPDAYVGQSLKGQFVVTNLGPDPATQPRLVGTLSGDVTLTNISSGNGLCRSTSDGYLCELNPLAKGESATIELTGTVNSETTVSFSVEALAAPETDPVSTNNTASASIHVSPESGNAGCSLDPRAPFDPSLPVLALLSLGGLIFRKRCQPQKI